MVLILLVSCEDVIFPTLEPASPVLAVDAWVNDQSDVQTIVLTYSQPYFDNTTPPAASGATVVITGTNGKVYPFSEDLAQPGKYRWSPTPVDTFKTGETYTLEITFLGEVYRASSFMGRVPLIDSISFESDTQLGSGKQITRGEFWATDPVGIGDAYWIRTFKNGVALLKPSEINIAYDAGLSIGGQTDGVTFIPPVRRRINAQDEDADGTLLSPIADGDSIQVQIHSITTAAFTYLNQVQIQTDRPGGFQELFSTPLANVSTNLVNTNPSGSKVLGFFNVSAVATAGKRYTE